MESVIVIIILAVLSALFDKSKKAKKNSSGQNSKQLGEDWAQGMKTTASAGQSQPKPPKQQYAGLDDYRRKLEQQPKTTPQQQTRKQPAPKPMTVANANKKTAPELCEAHPERTPNANLKGETMIEHELAAKKQSGKNAKPVTVVVKSEAPITSPVTLQPRDSLPQGIDLVAYMQQKQLTPMQQGILWSEILGEPVAKRPRGYYRYKRY